jgi:hypothetical protein
MVLLRLGWMPLPPPPWQGGDHECYDEEADEHHQGDVQPGHVQVQGCPQCPGQHEGVNGQRTPPVGPVVQDGSL